MLLPLSRCLWACAGLLISLLAVSAEANEPHKPRLFIISDISNEPDDAMSLTRFLVYANQFRTEGIVACTSTWLRNATYPDEMEKHVEAYGRVVSNLNAHVPEEEVYPTAESLLSLIKSGPTNYGMQALASNQTLSEGSQLLIEALQASEEPLWILAWGGTNTVAQALQHMEHLPDEVKSELHSRMRLYTISDQDDTGHWIRVNYPEIFKITSIHGWNQYGLSAWVGISGDSYYSIDRGGPDPSLVSQSWLSEHIQIGPLGELYPDVAYIMEGDTPTLLYMIQNGLGDPEHPEYGSWGGRYEKNTVSDAGGVSGLYADASDNVTGIDGNWYRSNKATIWRWREAFQNDFATRMQWTLSSDYADANHAPTINLNGTAGIEPLAVDSIIGKPLVLDASASTDPDDDGLEFLWYAYPEITATQSNTAQEVSELQIEKQNEQGSVVSVSFEDNGYTCKSQAGARLDPCRQYHLILEVKDNGSPALRSYRRVIIQAVEE